MSHRVEQLELPLPLSPGTVACVSPVHRMTSIPLGGMRRTGRCSHPRCCHRDYRTADQAPIWVFQAAFRRRYTWIQRFVEGGGGRDWRLLDSAIARARLLGLPPSEAPSFEELKKWVKQYQCSGFRGLLRKPK